MKQPLFLFFFLFLSIQLYAQTQSRAVRQLFRCYTVSKAATKMTLPGWVVKMGKSSVVNRLEKADLPASYTDYKPMLKILFKNLKQVRVLKDQGIDFQDGTICEMVSEMENHAFNTWVSVEKDQKAVQLLTWADEDGKRPFVRHAFVVVGYPGEVIVVALKGKWKEQDLRFYAGLLEKYAMAE